MEQRWPNKIVPAFLFFFFFFQLRNEVTKMEGKLRVTENLLQNKVSYGFTEACWD